MTLFKKLLLSSVLIGGASLSSITMADDFGCKAVLCFAGGQGLAECASTIAEVKKRLAKGKGFPHCSFIGPNGNQNQITQQSQPFFKRVNSPICPDGQTHSKAIFNSRYCNGITVTFKGINPDGGDLTKEINW